MKQHLFIFIVLGISIIGNAQNCIDSKLSKIFDFDILSISKDQNNLGKVEIVITIYDKGKVLKIQTIHLDSEFILKSESFKCKNNKSYSANTYLASDENDFGDLIIVDLNFDGKEDIAIKREEGGNGGPLYNFYIQSKNREFILDKYLSNEMSYFPDYLDSKEKTLHVNVRVDSLTKEGITYSYAEASKTWSVAKKMKYRN
jgi:hypothetical protein